MLTDIWRGDLRTVEIIIIIIIANIQFKRINTVLITDQLEMAFAYMLIPVVVWVP